MERSNTLEAYLRKADQASHFALLRSNEYDYPEGAFPDILAIGCKSECIATGNFSLEHLDQYWQELHGKAFGYISYQLSHQIEAISIKSNSAYQIPDIHFFEPLELISIPASLPLTESEIDINQVENFTEHIKREEYIKIINQLKEHIHRGDLYETNFCISFSGKANIDPVSTFIRLMQLSPMPFSAFLKLGDWYVLCASPERYLKRNGNTLISQPIKGTLAGDLSSDLLLSEKEQTENVMIVDLVRNDLSKVCEGGSVKVKELCGIYRFPGLYQMISTVEGSLEPFRSSTDALRATFPMGSMTGAPKYKAMELIEKYETFSRGYFSGSIGFIEPNGDFDLNVVIRSLFYQANRQQYYFSAGSAITSMSEPENEYEECLLKTRTIRRVLNLPV